MILTINGERAEFAAESLSVADLIATRATPSERGNACAVEVNRRLAARRDWQTTTLRDGDAVEIVTLVGGG